MTLAERSREFLDYLERFQAELPERAIDDVVKEAGGPDYVAIILVDLVCGFAKHGPLASPRVDATLPSILRMLQAAESAGVRAVALVQDSHPPEAVEFEQFPVHCVTGSGEDHAVPELQAYFRDSLMHPVVIDKNSLSAIWAPDFVEWHQEMQDKGVGTYIIVGDCTDLCVASLAVPLKTQANQDNRRLRLILPAECLETYDLPVSLAQELGAMPHDGDLLQAVFLYYLTLTGCEVVKRLS